MNEIAKPQWKLLVVIVNPGLSSRVIRIGRSAGIKGGTIVLGHGTKSAPLLQFLELADFRKEIVFMVVESQDIVDQALERLTQELHLLRPNHGIAFYMDVAQFLGSQHYELLSTNESEDQTMKHQAIFIIVDKGKGAAAMKAATEAGAQGGTIINARGSGIHETMTFLNMAIEPEKEIILIISGWEKTEAIVTSVKDKLEIEKPGNGIIFVQDVCGTVGLNKTM
ncbi:MAG: P-II family nitrogen regulator [Bacilli bacterium]|jgi:nitrogen regulatory protein PII